MKIKSKMKYEIVIEPQDNQYCGGCTYKTFNKKAYSSGLTFDFLKEWYCLLFEKALTSWDTYGDKKAPRCSDCKKITTNFMNMPELEEGR